jgi:hypothetical protein
MSIQAAEAGSISRNKQLVQTVLETIHSELQSVPLAVLNAAEDK